MSCTLRPQDALKDALKDAEAKVKVFREAIVEEEGKLQEAAEWTNFAKEGAVYPAAGSSWGEAANRHYEEAALEMRASNVLYSKKLEEIVKPKRKEIADGLDTDDNLGPLVAELKESVSEAALVRAALVLPVPRTCRLGAGAGATVRGGAAHGAPISAKQLTPFTPLVAAVCWRGAHCCLARCLSFCVKCWVTRWAAVRERSGLCCVGSTRASSSSHHRQLPGHCQIANPHAAAVALARAVRIVRRHAARGDRSAGEAQAGQDVLRRAGRELLGPVGVLAVPCTHTGLEAMGIGIRPHRF